MKAFNHFKILASILLLTFSVQNISAQLGFCSGNSGDPIFVENFGTGTDIGPALPGGVTSYNFTSGTPTDGSYTISNSTNYFDWHNASDHTPGDANGKMLVVNASFNAGEFYQTTIAGLCENTSYEFSAFLLSVSKTGNGCGDGLIPVNVKFQIWDDTNTNILASGDTGDLFDTTSPVWTPYGLVFKSEPGQTSVILKMINNGTGGCGNDLAIDDIVFKSCGDFVSLTNDPGENIISQCEDEGVIVSTTLTATPDFSIFSSHAYQWQESANTINWVDIAGETTASYTTPTLVNSRFFRVKVAEDIVNVSNPLCNVVSDVFSAIVVPIPLPPVSNGDVMVCANALTAMSVSVPDGQIVNWYDAPTDGNLLLANSTSYTPEMSGTFYAAASSDITDCFSPTRTSVNYTIYDLPVVSDETILFCENEPIMINAGVTNVTYEWSTGETTENIIIDQPGTYTMTATNTNGCSATKQVITEQIDQPIIEKIVSDSEDIIVTISNEGDYEYSLNNGPFQDSPIFDLVLGGSYTVNVRNKNNCPLVSQEFHHFVIPKFFSPNGDTFNDQLSLQGLDFFTNVDVKIFDRYGLLVKQSNSTSFTWDGNLNGQQLPSSDYWYVITADDLRFQGHFSLKR